MIRSLYRLSLALCFVLLLAAPVSAASEATQTIETTVNTVMGIIKNPEMHDAAKRPALLQQIENKVKTIFDFEEFSSRTVGPNWRTFNEDQRTRFISAFSSLLRASYIDKLDGYNGENVVFTGEVSNTKGDKVEVQTTVRIKDKAVPVAYRMLKTDSWKVYDVLIERVSLVENYRGQFKELLLRGDPESLIDKVESKANEIRTQNQTGKK